KRQKSEREETEERQKSAAPALMNSHSGSSTMYPGYRLRSSAVIFANISSCVGTRVGCCGNEIRLALRAMCAISRWSKVGVCVLRKLSIPPTIAASSSTATVTARRDGMLYIHACAQRRKRGRAGGI